MEISRRELLEHFGRGAVCLAVSNFIGVKEVLGQGAGASPSPEADYRKWEDLYRKQWTWDKIVHGTHAVGCTAQCEWNVFVKDGVAFKEEQIEHPRSTNPESPDPGPQGCQRGACYTNHMYGPNRIKYPLKRIGARGEGKWMRVSWEEALTEAADAMIDAMVKDGGARTIHVDFGDETPQAWRFFYTNLGCIQADTCVTNGDNQMGYYATFGNFGLPQSTKLFDADLIFIWHFNPLYTLIPYYKEYSQARYRGAQVITVAPDLSPSAIHADYWIPVEPGTDIALALGMCQVLVEEKLYKPGFLKEQTDLPFLVRDDTQKFLRQTDLESGGKEDQFYVYDLKAKKVVPARKDTLELGSVDPALEGRYEVTLADGRKLPVRPVFERLKEVLNNYKPEAAAELISRPFAKVHPEVIREVARKAAQAKTMRVTSGMNASKCYHGDLINRSIALFLALSGHATPGGSPGSFWRFLGEGARTMLWEIFQGGAAGRFDQGKANYYPLMDGPDVEDAVAGFNKRKAVIEEIMREDPTRTIAMAVLEQQIRERKRPPGSNGSYIPGWQWMYYRAGFKDRWDNKQWHDPHYKDFSSYVEEANKKGWYDGFIGPDKEKVPLRDRVVISAGGNQLRRNTGSKVLFEDYIPSLEKIIGVDFRMSASCLYADLVLPCAGWYEQVLVRSNIHWLLDKAVEPLGEAKSDWSIVCLLAKKISERAKERGIPKIYDSRLGITLELDKFYDQWTKNGAYKEGDDEKIADLLYRIGASLGIFPPGLNLEEVRKANNIPPSPVSRAGGSVLVPGLSLPADSLSSTGGNLAASGIQAGTSGTPPSLTRDPFGGAVESGKLPHPTLTRRMQFYLDHDWLIEAGEALPVHRPHPPLGGDYPFHQTGGHGRESVHSVWIGNPLLLRLTRGVPSLFMNKEEAERLGIGDFEEVEVYNDAGLYRVRVKHSALVRPNQVAIYHCWEPYQFSKGHYQAVNPCTAKPLLLASGLGHITHSVWTWQPIVARRGARVNIRKISA